jgi:putative spermidine/putrescine transport system ATP-binding protein
MPIIKDAVPMQQRSALPSYPLLRLDSLAKRFGSHVAVDAISLDVQQGEFISLLGPSGCGKTTTLQMIGGFLQPDSGGILLGGRDLVSVRPHQRGLGIVFQSYALFPHMTAAENVSYGLEVQRVGKAERARRVRDALTLVGLGSYGDRYPRRMSGGQQQRVALARALVIRPSVLLLDEPLSNLDAKLREEMQIELRRIQRVTGTTTILVTHDQAEAMALSDRIVLMNKGRIEQIGAPEDVYERPATSFVAQFLGKTNLLQVQVVQDGRRFQMQLEGLHWSTTRALPAGPTAVRVRPEKIAITEGEGLGGIVRTCIFQGAHWLLEVETVSGLISVLRQNNGGKPPREGDAVRLAWPVDDMHPVAAG